MVCLLNAEVCSEKMLASECKKTFFGCYNLANADPSCLPFQQLSTA